MPSGAKKRKAAKKKKELEAHINPSSQRNEDVKSQDDKGSDSGEIDSPASQNHPSHSNPFGEGNKEIQESSSSNAGVSSNVGTTQKVGLASEEKNGTVQYESIKGSHDDDRSCSSSSSSSDDESVDATKKPEVLVGKSNNLVVPTAASIVNLVTPEISASEETISIVESTSVQNTAIPDMIASKKLESTHSHATDRVTYVPVTAPRDLPSKPNQHLSAHSKDSESPENLKPESEEQPLIGSRPPVPQRTSWLSCCGLCDVFTGSNR